MQKENAKFARAEIDPALRLVLQLGSADPLPRQLPSAARGKLVASGWLSIRYMVDADGSPSTQLEDLVRFCQTTCESDEQRELLTAERLLAALWQVHDSKIATGAAKISIGE
jgi:hypothetical protein